MTDKEIAHPYRVDVAQPVAATLPPSQLYGEVVFSRTTRRPKCFLTLSVPLEVVEGWRQRLEVLTAEVNAYGLDFSATIKHPTEKD